MALTDQDQDTIELIATRVAEKFAEAQSNAVQAMIDQHQSLCPHGRRLMQTKWFLAGVVAALVLTTAGGSALGSILVRLLSGP